MAVKDASARRRRHRGGADADTGRHARRPARHRTTTLPHPGDVLVMSPALAPRHGQADRVWHPVLLVVVALVAAGAAFAMTRAVYACTPDRHPAPHTTASPTPLTAAAPRSRLSRVRRQITAPAPTGQ